MRSATCAERPRVRRARDPAAHPGVGRAGRGASGGLRQDGRAGFLGVPIPERYGGAGMDYIAFALLCEEMERADTAFRVILSVHTGLNFAHAAAMGERGPEAALPRPAGPRREAGHLRPDRAGRRQRRRQPVDDRPPRRRPYILNGSKIWISLADTADHFLVFATVDKSAAQGDHRLHRRARVPRPRPPASLHGKLGVRAGNTGILDLLGLRGPARATGSARRARASRSP